MSKAYEDEVCQQAQSSLFSSSIDIYHEILPTNNSNHRRSRLYYIEQYTMSSFNES